MNGKMKNVYKIWVGKPEAKRILEGLGIFGRIVLKWTFRKSGGKIWTGFIWLSIGMGGVLF
jgi:hypothetical protein